MPLPGGHQRSHLGGVGQRVADGQTPPGEVGDGVDDLGVTGSGGCEDAGAEPADLPVVEKCCCVEGVEVRGQVGVVEDDGGGLSAELEGDGGAEQFAAGAADGASGTGGAGERDFVDAPPVGNEIGAEFASAGDDVQHA